MLRCNVLVEGGKVRGREGGEGQGQSEEWKQPAEEARSSFPGRAPEALHIPARLIEAVSVFVFSACELPPDYRETAVHPLPPDCVIMQRVTTKTNTSGARSSRRHASSTFFPFHKLSLI